MIDCVRCKREGNEIDALPHKGALGEEIKAKICSLCWVEWKEESIKIVNEHRLKLSEPAARAFLSTQMKVFLKLSPHDTAITISASL
jgi:Fe-S cluster biosynthesis and repair protein YggX